MRRRVYERGETVCVDYDRHDAAYTIVGDPFKSVTTHVRYGIDN